jgi:DNA-binding transcriptional MerR regulator
MKNKDIREAAKRQGVFLWQIAERLDLHDSNFSRKLRKEMPDEEKARILKVIDEIAQEGI